MRWTGAYCSSSGTSSRAMGSGLSLAVSWRAEEAAEREVLEETGLEIRVSGIVGLYSYEGQIPAIAVFAGMVTGGEAAPLDETMDVRTFPKDGLPWAELAFPSTEHALKDYLRRR